MNISVVDVALLLVLLVSIVLGAWRGLLYEVMSVAGWVAAFFLAQWLALDAAAWLPMDGAAEPLRYAAGFVAVFVVAAFAAGLLAWLVKKAAEAMGLRPVDRTLGAVFGFLRGTVILLAVVVVVVMTPLREHEQWRASTGADWLTTTLMTLRPLLPAELGAHLP